MGSRRRPSQRGSRSTIGRDLKDLAAPDTLAGEVRRPGGGGPTLIEKDPTLLENLRHLVEPATTGDPMRPLMWVSKSHVYDIAANAGCVSVGIGNDTAQFAVNSSGAG